MNRPEPDRFDPMIHAYLDGEMDPEAIRAFELRIEAEPDLRGRVEALRSLDGWIQESRPEAPPSLARRVQESLAASPTSTPLLPENRPTLGRWWNGLFPRWGWGLTTAGSLALILAAVVLLDRSQEKSPSGSLEPMAGVPAPEQGEIGDEDRTVLHQFLVDAGAAEEVCLVGDFNLWKICANPLERSSDGRWRVSVEIPEGRHEYMFVIDNRWVTDPAASVRVDDGFGHSNAVLLL